MTWNVRIKKRNLFFIQKKFFYRFPSSKKKQLFSFCYLKGNLVAISKIKSKFENFLNFRKHRRNDFGDYITNFAIENKMFQKSQRMMIHNFKLEYGTVKFLLFLSLTLTWKLVFSASKLKLRSIIS